MSRAGGTRPRGTATEEQAARWVRDMFAGVAPRYDLLNHLLSFHIDRYWRARTVRRVRSVLERPDALAMDLACGTGDLFLALEKRARCRVLGSDFCHPMLTAARRKAEARRLPGILFEADGLRLPLGDESLDLITVAFGFRNFANYQRGLNELYRVLKPGGILAILEFSRPPNPIFRRLYDFYSRRILPAIGGAFSGSRTAYAYLPESVRKFPGALEFANQMKATGFSSADYELLTGGIVALHLASR
ncbi:MAG: bifunctional demethylmenaquinone methyltransferase/2-methoxy-6-polyprenyl-1,4-benzoquinol methylase UbiE [Acidobacteria bacterium]|nr:bifunctional demethylmenaquinone methyltransferase/2-methoxy-6-polyprenyl-1,4-benzoquinol methylase UbiE [Acidobacteriota bacterium]